MLTVKQHELLMYVHGHLQRAGVSPSFDEMKVALDLKSKSGIHRLVTALEERGFIRRLAHRARALEVLRMPDSAIPQPALAPAMAGAAPSANGNSANGNNGGKNGGNDNGPAMTPAARSPGFAPSIIHGRFPSGGGAASAGNDNVALPLYGRIAAGTPIEALRDHSNLIQVPASLLGKGEHYALEISGDSMIDAGIFNGDTVIIQACDSAENGSIVVALIDEQEATLKRLRRKGHAIALEAANAAYETRIFGPDRVKIQGRLVGLLRRY